MRPRRGTPNASHPKYVGREILGLHDPLTIASEEARLLAIVSADKAGAALAALRSHPLGREAAIIGTVQRRARRCIRTDIGWRHARTEYASRRVARGC